jgi:tRNA-dihydrouridine synthase B
MLEDSCPPEEAGIAAITVHGRTVDQGYSGRADWEAIKQVKERVSIPVIGNGDIDSAKAALEMLKVCRCDGVMVGRASRGNPWIFAEISAAFKGLPLPEPPTPGEIVAMALRHFTLLAEFKGEAAAAREMRRHSAWYIRGLPGAAAVRQQLVQISSYAETENNLAQFCC